MPVRTELNLRLPNSPGALASICRTLADERVSIVGLSLEANGQLRLVVDNHVGAMAALRAAHHQVAEREVLFVAAAHAPGAAAALLKLAADAGVNVEYAYATVDEHGRAASIVLGVADARRASAAAGL